ncbi:MAG: hypothetical protein GX892_09285 [Thermoanaerobacteraceae bacterium]|nr:hypothetical protein [Thermoanaerobacteraceae bacterium]
MFSKIFVPLLALKQKFMPDENCEWHIMEKGEWTRVTRKERMIKIIKRQPVDRLPVSLELTVPLVEKLSIVLNLSQDELFEVLDNHIIYAYLSDSVSSKDNIVIDNWGVGYDIYEGAAIRIHPLYDKRALKDYEFPDPSAEWLMDGPKATIAKYGDDYFVTSYQRWLLFERACWLRGVENFLTDMIVDRPFAEWLLDRITEYQVEVARKYIEIGIDCGRTGDDWGSQMGMLFSPDLWRGLIKPRLKKVWDVYHDAGLPVIHHSCGDIRPIIPDLIELGLDVLHPVQAVMPREELKKNFGAKLVFYGGIDTQHIVPLGAPEEIYFEVTDCINTLGAGGGYIVGLGHTLTSEVPLINIGVLITAVRDKIGLVSDERLELLFKKEVMSE